MIYSQINIQSLLINKYILIILKYFAIIINSILKPHLKSSDNNCIMEHKLLILVQNIYYHVYNIYIQKYCIGDFIIS